MRNALKMIALTAVIFAIAACDSVTNNHSLSDDVLEDRIHELQSMNSELEAKISELESKLLEKEAEIENLHSSIDFDPALNHSNIESHYGAFDQGLWGESGHIYSGYIKTILHRLFYLSDYLWVEGGEVEENPVEDLLLNEQFENHLLGITFVNPISVKAEVFPNKIKEVVLYAKEGINKVFILNHEQKWHAYEVLDSQLNIDFKILQLIREAYTEWISKP